MKPFLPALLLVFAASSVSTALASGGLATGRSNHTATLLDDGRVLVAGGVGINGSTLFSTELYDPVTGTWSASGGLRTAHTDHTATLLPGGFRGDGRSLWTARSLLPLSRFGSLLPGGKLGCSVRRLSPTDGLAAGCRSPRADNRP